MKWTIIGDPHAKPDNLEKIGTLFDIIEAIGNPTIFLGDFLDTKEVVRSRCFNLIFDRIRKSKLFFYILVGNHDWHNLECQDHSLRALAVLPNVEIIDKPQYRGLDAIVWDKTSERLMLLIPYFHDLEKFREVVSESMPDCDLLVMHQGVTGFDYGNGYIAENEVDFKELSSFKKVISGHFHKRQEVGNLVYPGTPFSHSFGESNQKKYIAVLDSESLELEFVETPFPMHTTLELDCDRDESYVLQDYLEAAPEDYVRAVLKGTQENINKFDKSAYSGVKFIEKPAEEIETTVEVSETDSNEAKFHKWATEVRELEPETVKLGLEILRDLE